MAHVNADWPAEFGGTAPSGIDHDPVVARYVLPASLEQLQALLDYYAAKGLVDATTATQLRGHWTQAAGSSRMGPEQHYRSQPRRSSGPGPASTRRASSRRAQLIAEAQRLLVG